MLSRSTKKFYAKRRQFRRGASGKIAGDELATESLERKGKGETKAKQTRGKFRLSSSRGGNQLDGKSSKRRSR